MFLASLVVPWSNNDAHSCGSQCVAGGVIQDSSYLFQRYAWEPFDELSRRGTVFKVFKQRETGTRVPKDTHDPVRRRDWILVRTPRGSTLKDSRAG
jgi:hypothetical protein